MADRPGDEQERSLAQLCRAFVKGFADRDADALGDLYLPSATVRLGDAEDSKGAVTVAPAVAIEDRMRLGLPLTVTVTGVVEDGWQAEVLVEWTVSGTSADGTEIDLAGSAVLACEERHGRWYIASERLRYS
ncbi:YybH family protein [Sinomonas mesophila]|uniref:YybH family protein n=1 Tax=Sinomonas mesophila TaxID=1531955 RepID=UPI000985C6DC|nr:nuclear transport factor 2 family protein [Sinomonas mesophila]